MRSSRLRRRAPLAPFALLSTLLAAGTASAHASGITSAEFPSLDTGCNGCHQSAVPTPTVTLLADQTCLTAGGSATIRATVTSTNGTEAGWNLRISSGAGTLAVGGSDSAQTQVLSGEVTHTMPKMAAADTLIHFSAVYTAPNTA